MAAAAPAAGPSIPSAVSGQFFGSNNSNASNISSGASVLSSNVTQFREIHKNSWLKRLTPEGKKITVGHKKSERSWVVFCVHDDCEPMLEGYSEPRHAASHTPEWVMSIQDTLHISHALIPNSHEFEFVITLSNGVLRFHASSWEMMQEWVETLRSKLREMKILSPRENIYTKLPEVRTPLLPTRDPTSPLPAPPPVPAAFVPGVEPVVPQRLTREPNTSTPESSAGTVDINEAERTEFSSEQNEVGAPSSCVQISDISSASTTDNAALKSQESNGPLNLSMSNTLPQNLINMLSDPITAYSDQINKELNEDDSSEEDQDGDPQLDILSLNLEPKDLSRTKDTSQMDNDEVDIEMQIKLETGSLLFDYQRLCSPYSDPSDVESFEFPTTTADSRIQRPRTSSTHFFSFECDEMTKKQLGRIMSCPEDIPKDETQDKSAIDPTANITIIQVSTCGSKGTTKPQQTSSPLLLRKSAVQHQDQHTSNIQINPSATENTSNIAVQVSQAGAETGATTNAPSVNRYSSPIRNIPNKSIVSCIPTSPAHNVSSQVNTVTKVPIGVDATPSASNETSIYSKCFLSTSTPTACAQGLSKKIILTANPSGITNIEVHNPVNPVVSEDNLKIIRNPASSTNQDMETKVTTTSTAAINRYCEKVFLSSSPEPVDLMAVPSTSSTAVKFLTKIVPTDPSVKTRSPNQKDVTANTKVVSVVSTTATTSAVTTPQSKKISIGTHTQKHTSSTNISNVASASEASNLLPIRPRLLMRGLTEAVISTRPSRKDIHLLKSAVTPKPKSHSCHNNNKSQLINNSNHNNNGNKINSNNNCNDDNASASRNTSSADQRRRSSSTSDVQIQRSIPNTYNNATPVSRLATAGEPIPSTRQTFRSPENGISGHALSPPPIPNSMPAKRMTLREQQVIQLRREIMHPGGVRLQLRRKDAVGSIAWVDAFGTVWVAGWKQKEHPVLYNALHIGDQLISIAGVPISSASDANKIIRNTHTLFIEVLVRRIPFGRGYAIRRDREGQCLGLIRDENSSTIVDVIPNSLAARHGLPPKAQSCDGTTLTFWVLTEINGRPLNLFFKDNEIRDRLNSVGRDISILVQPSDLITKLKKQLKSLRGYKDYLLQ